MRNMLEKMNSFRESIGLSNGLCCIFKVHLTCGPEHQLTNAYEPSRCEYAFDFITPCACNQPPQPQDKDPHDEL